MLFTLNIKLPKVEKKNTHKITILSVRMYPLLINVWKAWGKTFEGVK